MMDCFSDDNDGLSDDYESDSSGYVVKGSGGSVNDERDFSSRGDTDRDEKNVHQITTIDKLAAEHVGNVHEVTALDEQVPRQAVEHNDKVDEVTDIDDSVHEYFDIEKKDDNDQTAEHAYKVYETSVMDKQVPEQAAEHKDTAMDEQEHEQAAEQEKAILEHESKRIDTQTSLVNPLVTVENTYHNKTNEKNPGKENIAVQDLTQNKSFKVTELFNDVTRDDKEEVLFEETLEVKEIRPGSLPQRLMKEIFDDYEERERPSTSSSVSTMVSLMEGKSDKVQDLLADWGDSDSDEDQNEYDWEEYESISRMDVTENSFVELASKLSASEGNLATNKEDTAADREQSAADREQSAASKEQSEMECNERASTGMSSSTASEDYVDKGADFMCDVCQEFFDTRIDLRQHKKHHHPKENRTYTCDKCDKTFAMMRNLKMHKKIHVHRCEICRSNFANIGDLNAHCREHESKETIECNICRKIFPDKDALRSHKRQKHWEYSCELCKKRFETADDLSEHKSSHNKDKYVSCDVCDAKVNNKYDLQKHKRKHTGEQPYSCDLCDRRFISNSALTGHKKIKHKDEKDSKEAQYSCDLCGLSYTDPTKLLDHKSIHRQKPFLCTICKLLFKLESDLTAHKLAYPCTKHASCDICYKTVSDKDTLTRHKRLHTGERPFVCNICDKTFASNSNFRSHLRSHIKETTYSCNHCDKSFPYKVSLNRHLKSKHDDLDFSSDGTITPTQPRFEFACDLCKKSYPLKNSLTRHMRTNHSLMPNFSTENNAKTCELCNTIIKNNNWSRHMQKVHAPKIENKILKSVRGPCRFCGEDLALKNRARHESSCPKNPNPTRPKSKAESSGAFSCNDCDKRYVKKSSLYRHIRSAHKKEPSFKDFDEQDEEKDFDDENYKQSESNALMKSVSVDDKETGSVIKIRKNVNVCLKYDDINNVYN